VVGYQSTGVSFKLLDLLFRQLVFLSSTCEVNLVITNSDQLVDELQVDPPGVLSDHSLISWHLHQPPIVQPREVRSWSKVDRDEFRAALLSSQLCSTDQRPSTMEGYFDLYHGVLQLLADRFAPVQKIRKCHQRLAAWIDEECRQQRCQSRHLE